MLIGEPRVKTVDYVRKSMIHDPRKHHRRSTRLSGYDYRQPGAYFVTICTRDRVCVLGRIDAGEVWLSEQGVIATALWRDIAERFPHVCVDTFVVMPNHVHTIIIIEEMCRGGVTPPLHGGQTPPLIDVDAEGERMPSLGQIVAYYKYQTTKQINRALGTPGAPFWQRNYFDHVIRSERELKAIRRYIAENSLKWDLDRDHPANI